MTEQRSYPQCGPWAGHSLGERRITVVADHIAPDHFWLTLHEIEGVPFSSALFDRGQLRALGAAARLMSGAEQEDWDTVRRDERERLATLFEDNREILAAFPKDAGSVIDLICLLLRMGHRDANEQPTQGASTAGGSNV
jgi:hypothetical protein